ncbi:MAG: alanine:cation symporter family protein [Candidatus Babeliaceae bacterium]|nr:alanine:cation symporter family protein [Candidatus Babeliaceae bacterium]
MTYVELDELIKNLGGFLWGWPLIISIMGVSFIMTFAFGGIQFRYFMRSWQYLLKAESAQAEARENYITPFQAFINALSASLGNGSLAGMATAMYSGGPGAGFWIFFLGFFLMAIRFAEVYASTAFTEKQAGGLMRGGPMVYLARVPGGSWLPYFYAFFCLMLTFVTGNAMQCNSIALGLEKMTAWNIYAIAAVMFLFLLYIMVGGAQRIIKVSDAITPIKVGLFFVATLLVLFTNINSLWGALVIMTQHAFTLHAARGALIGYTMQSALRFGLARSINATEVGVGTSGIIFGTTGTSSPVRSGIISLATTSISNFGVCFLLMWLFVATGAWQSEFGDIRMTIQAYETTFGSFGGWIVNILAMMFGIGCVIAYAYIGRQCWSFLTGGKYLFWYSLIFCFMALFGALVEVRILWNAIDVVNAALIISNLYGLMWLMPEIQKGVRAFYVHDRKRN